MARPQWVLCTNFFFRLSNPNSLSVLSLQRISSPLKLFTDILWNLIDVHLSCAEDSRSGQSTPGEVTQEQNREEESPSSTCRPPLFWYNWGYGWYSRLWAHGVDSCLAFHLQESPSFLWFGDFCHWFWCLFVLVLSWSLMYLLFF